jgi:hypothetical protein
MIHRASHWVLRRILLQHWNQISPRTKPLALPNKA